MPQAAAETLCIGYSLVVGEEAIDLCLPALMPQVQVTLAGTVGRGRVDGALLRDPAVAIVGAANSATRLWLAPGSTVIGVGVMPVGWQPLLGVAADACSDVAVDAAALWGPTATDALLGRMLEQPDLAAQVGLLVGSLVARIAASRLGGDGRVPLACAWLSRAGEVGPDDLARRLELTPRSLQRFTRRHFGAGPAQLEMKYRVLRLAATAALHGMDVSADDRLAVVQSFYDQSHLIRQFSRVVGWTPARFERDQAAFARRMLVGRWRAGLRTPVGLWS